MKKKVSLIVLALIMVLTLCLLPFFTGCVSAEVIYALSEDGDHYFVYASGTNLSEEAFEGICPYYSEELGPVTEETEDSLPVTAIAARGFFGCTKLTYIVVPDFITTIGYSAFAYCLSLKSITLSNNLTSIPYGIFGADNSLFSVEIPESVERIETYAFYLSHLHEITIPASVTYMGDGVFYRCDYLEKVEIYADIDTIPYATFCSCQKLKEVILPKTIKEIKGLDYLNGNREVISEDDIIEYVYGAENDTENPNYVDNVVQAIPAFYYTYIEAGSENITFDYELETLRYLGTEEELNQIVVGEYNVCLTESTNVYCWEDNDWKGPVKWNF